ncbi:MAG: 30S ribosomal protein S20 [Actinobacteria bacterium]|nr:30S ribosomal protein S20 [Acidimicrobiaceae bacterium]MBD35606.1 30S ribosomal protein S20 [Actinomycetota bacterium]
MANIKSQIKRNRQTEKQRERNRMVRSELRTRTKAVLESDDSSQEALSAAMKRIDTAAAKRVIHPNNAARKKSRLQKRFNELNN